MIAHSKSATPNFRRAAHRPDVQQQHGEKAGCEGPRHCGQMQVFATSPFVALAREN